ncbi:ATP-binding protein [Haemophilus influenzae]|uniref:AlbA family DNA-binding domain-containing protein n=1 Tax=Haemophilus influenzae TaxID=727 RepID=UPI000A68A16F|nr:hypothetical protein [Haemophilus influenzae]
MNHKEIHQLQHLADELIKLPKENEWVEFKTNNKDPKMIGEDISALSNSAALLGKVSAYMV